jgi:ABC-type dipeptide/oligopeptide/nickel transport system ATPase subunit
MPESRAADGTARAALEVEDVGHGYGPRGRTTWVLEGVSFRLGAGETLAVVGESGAGKSTLSRLIAGLETPRRGRVLVDGQAHRVRSGRVSPVQMVFQHPEQALSRHISVGSSVAEPVRARPRAERRAMVETALEQVGISGSRARDKPAAFSGGQLQRIVTARALIARPAVLLCDEPTSALDVSVQAQIVNLLLEQQAERNYACVLVTHDLGVAKVLADHILVLKDGRMVELSGAEEFFAGPSAAYSRELLANNAAQTFGGAPELDR